MFRVPLFLKSYGYRKLETILRLRAILWSTAFALTGLALVLIYHDADQQDSGYHYLFARWALIHPHYFVGVWARPLFTLFYFFPSQLGYSGAKLFTVATCLATAWQTFRLAEILKIQRPELAIPLLFLQPSFFLLSSVVLTETLFALIFVIALRLHITGRKNLSLLVVSMLILIRPEGFFIGALWGLWYLNRSWRHGRGSIATFLLLTGMILWWVAAYLITGDPLWIAHDWPPDWQAGGRANGTGPIWWFIAQLPLIVGPLFLIPFFFGLLHKLHRHRLGLSIASFLTLFILHSLMYWRGWFGSAGYGRYLVCVSPAIALISLRGWNEIGVLKIKAITAAIFLFSASICLFYVDGWRASRDARAVEEMHIWFIENQKPVNRLITSQIYMRIVFDRDPLENPAFGKNREENLEILKRSGSGTLVFWDEDTGAKWFALRADDLEAAGYTRLVSRDYRLGGFFYTLPRDGFGGARSQRMYLFYKK